MVRMSRLFRSRRPARPAGHTVRYARPTLEQLESRYALSVMYPSIMTYSVPTGPTIEAYSPMDNVLRTYGDGFQTITGAYAPQAFATNNTGLFAIDNGGAGEVTVSASNPTAAIELGNSGMAMLNTQVSFAGTVTPLSSPALLNSNNGGTLLEVPSGKNGAFASSDGIGGAPTSLETPFTPYITLLVLPSDGMDTLLAMSYQSTPAPYAPGLSVDPSQSRLGLVNPVYQGAINYLQMTPRATMGAGASGAATAPLERFEEVTPEELEELQREMLNHLRMISWDATLSAPVGQDSEESSTAAEVQTRAEPPAEHLCLTFDELLPPLPSEVKYEPWLQAG